MFEAVFFVWLTAGAAPVGLKTLQSFPTRPDCVAYVAPILHQLPSAAQVSAYCPTAAALRLGNYGEAVR